MDILFVYIDYFKNYDIVWAIKEMGYRVDTIDEAFMSYENNDLVCKILEGRLHNKYDMVMSYGFNKDVSNICEKNHVKYVSWTYDSFTFTLHDKVIENECNYIFVFDKWEMELLKKNYNQPHIYHLPLCANNTRINNLATADSDIANYGTDLAFVGTLYNNNEYDDLASGFTENNRGYFQDVFNYFVGKWNNESIYDWFSIDEVRLIDDMLPEYARNDTDIDGRYYYAAKILNRKIGQLERKQSLRELAKDRTIRLYSDIENNRLDCSNVEQCPRVNYFDEMSKAFLYARINLNITLRGIRTGIPLRCFDVMGAGGFLLSSYQEELMDYFIPGEDMDIFHSIEELRDKSNFYLSHEDIRSRIALNGYRKINAEHTYVHRMEEICRIVLKVE